jgi:hypothetical protein
MIAFRSMKIQVANVYSHLCELEFPGPRVKLSDLRSRLMRHVAIDARRVTFSHRGVVCDDTTIFTPDQMSDGATVMVFDHSAFPEKSFPRVDSAFQFSSSRFESAFVNETQQLKQEEALSHLLSRRHPHSHRIGDEAPPHDQLASLFHGSHFDGLPYQSRSGRVERAMVDPSSSDSEDQEEGTEEVTEGEQETDQEEDEEEEDGPEPHAEAVMVDDIVGRALAEGRRSRENARLGPLNITLSPDEGAVIERLMQTGHDRGTVLQVYEVCGRSEHDAMNCLLSMT